MLPNIQKQVLHKLYERFYYLQYKYEHFPAFDRTTEHDMDGLEYEIFIRYLTPNCYKYVSEQVL